MGSFFILTLPSLLISYLLFFQIISLPNWLNWTLGIIAGILVLFLLILWANITDDFGVNFCSILQVICLEILFFTAPALKIDCWMWTSILLSIYLLFAWIALFIRSVNLTNTEADLRHANFTATIYKEQVDKHDAIARRIKNSL